MNLNPQHLGDCTFSRHLVSRQYQHNKRKRAMVMGLMLKRCGTNY